PILVDVNVHPTKLEVRLSKEEQLYQLIVSKIQEAFKDRILIPKNNLDYVPKKNKVLHSFEQQKIEFEQRQNTENNQEKTFSSEESNSKPFMAENQNDEIVIKEDSYNPFVTKTSESLIADDESSGYNNTREKDEDYFKKQQEILQEMGQTFDSNDDTFV
ncbi:DNA mismatch repair protein MutL, partial [Staphylococcus aureus]